MSLLRNRAARVDLAWAALLAVLVAGGLIADGFDGAIPLGIAAGLATGAVMLVRRRRPLEVLAGVLVVGIALPGSGVLDLPAAALVYTIATRRPLTVAVAAAVVASIAVIAHDVIWSQPVNASSIVSAVVQNAAVLALGLYVEARRLQAEADRSRAVDEERLRIARELHDVVAHNVSLMVVQAQALGATAGSEPVSASTDAIADLGRQAMTEMHRTLQLLRGSDGPGSAEREPQPGLDDLAALAERARGAGLWVELDVDGDRRALAPGIELSAYRIVQEALTNVVRHAHATQAAVRVSYGADGIRLTISDDGTGGAEVPGNGHGLLGMRERAELFGGSLTTRTREEGGYEVSAALPYGEQEPRR